MRGGWYQDTIFNLHFDHHVRPEQPNAGAGAKQEELIPLIAACRPGAVQYHAKGHPGWTTYPTKLGWTHPTLAQDLLRLYREITRELGVPFLVYYSSLVDEQAGTHHPEWRIHGPEGKPVEELSHLCPNTGYVDELMLPQIEEIIREYDPDGFWFDGDGSAVCYCPRCRQMFEESYGKPPPQDEDDPAIEDLRAFSREVNQEYKRKCAEFIHRLKRDCLYASNYAYSSRWPLTPPDYADWLSADIACPPKGRQEMSLEARMFSTQGKPFDLMTFDQVYPRQPEGAKPHQKPVHQLQQEGALILAHGGRWFYWTNPRPDDHLPPSQMKIAAQCAEFAHQRREVCHDTEGIPWVALANTTLPPRRSDAIWGGHQALTELHYDPQIMNQDSLKTKIGDYSLLVLAEEGGLDDELIGVVRESVERGGCLLATGITALSGSEGQTADLLGIKVEEKEVIEQGFLLHQELPIRIPGPWHRIALEGAEEWYPLLRSDDERAPDLAGWPAVTANRVGQGVAVYVAGDVFSAYKLEQYPPVRELVGEIISRLLPDPMFRTDVPPTVEITLRRKGSDLLIHLCNLSVDKNLSANLIQGIYPYYIEQVPVVGPVEITIRCPNRPTAVTLEPGGESLPHRWEQGRLSVTIPSLEIHRCLRAVAAF